MLGPSGELLRARLGLKLNQVKTATRSYLRDRAQQASPPKLDQADAAKAAATVKAAAAVLMASPTPPRRPSIRLHGRNGRNMQIGLVVMAALVGLAATRRRRPSPESRS
ncbi:MAG TPA: hypothetical protein VNS33_03620 [Bradyrhizobium sp.]|nr:hypothetical protein [Bradyrhizobium sp.]